MENLKDNIWREIKEDSIKNKSKCLNSRSEMIRHEKKINIIV